MVIKSFDDISRGLCFSNFIFYRKLEAEQSYKYALKVGLKDPDLLDEIKRVQTKVGFGDAGF